jgi:hypothetical protein
VPARVDAATILGRLSAWSVNEALLAFRVSLGLKRALAATIQARHTEAPSEPRLTAAARFVKADGFWVFTGTIDSNLIPDHRELRETHLDPFVRAAIGEDSD